MKVIGYSNIIIVVNLFDFYFFHRYRLLCAPVPPNGGDTGYNIVQSQCLNSKVSSVYLDIMLNECFFNNFLSLDIYFRMYGKIC